MRCISHRPSVCLENVLILLHFCLFSLSGRADQVSSFRQKGSVKMEKQIAANRKHLVCKSYHFRTRTDLGDPQMSESGRLAIASVQLREAGTSEMRTGPSDPERTFSLCFTVFYIKTWLNGPCCEFLQKPGDMSESV